MGYKDELQFVIDANKDIFPEFLFTPLFNDFGDEYYKIGLSQDPRVIEAQKIRRKYRNYFDYINAMMSYNDYMNYLIDKYGSLSIIKNSVKVGLFEDFVPPKPKLKMSRVNKEFVRSKIVPSRKVDLELDIDIIRQIANELYPIKSDSIAMINEDSRYDKVDKKTRRINRIALMKISGQNRRNNLYRSSGNNEGVDFIIEYMNQANKGNYDEVGKRVEYSITDILKEERNQIGIPDELLDDAMIANTTVVVGDRLVSRKDQQRFDIMSDLYKIGIDLLDSSKSMDKKAVKMIKMAAGDYDAFEDTAYMSKKELSRFKKRKKREQKDLIKRQDNDRLLTNTLLTNKFSFQTNGNNINFRLRDLYKDD